MKSYLLFMLWTLTLSCVPFWGGFGICFVVIWNIKKHVNRLFTLEKDCVVIQINTGLGLWCKMPFSTIFQWYCGSQFYWLRKPEYLEKPLNDRKSLTNFITYCCIEYTSSWVGIELTILIVRHDCICSCKFNYYIVHDHDFPQINTINSAYLHTVNVREYYSINRSIWLVNKSIFIKGRWCSWWYDMIFPPFPVCPGVNTSLKV